jgi:hypothetical protein
LYGNNFVDIITEKIVTANTRGNVEMNTVTEKTTYRNRILGVTEVEVSALEAAPEYCLIHTTAQYQMYATFLELVGWVYPVVLNRTTGNVISSLAPVRVADHHDVTHVPALVVELSREEERAVVTLIEAISKMSHLDTHKIDEYLTELRTSKGYKTIKLLFRQARESDTLPFQDGESRLRNRTEARNAPLRQQDSIKRQCAKGKELWLLGETELLGYPAECMRIITAWEQATGEMAVKLLGPEDVKRRAKVKETA